MVIYPSSRKTTDARVVELADSLDSGSSVHSGRAGSSPASRTRNPAIVEIAGFFLYIRAFRRFIVARARAVFANVEDREVLPGLMLDHLRRPSAFTTLLAVSGPKFLSFCLTTRYRPATVLMSAVCATWLGSDPEPFAQVCRRSIFWRRYDRFNATQFLGFLGLHGIMNWNQSDF